MKSDDDPSLPPPTLSLAARLQRRYGTDVDPRVDLASAPAAPLAPAGDIVPAPSSASSSRRTLQRLEGRSGAAQRYRVQGEVARGGMGAILEVFDEDLRRRLAMKVILDRHTKSAGADTSSVEPAALSRFLEEAQITGQLDHPGIVPVHELGLDEQGRVYFTMRLVHGRDLEAIFALAVRNEDDWSVPRAVAVLQKVCEAMAYAHEKGVVHRDLKPQNVMVGRFGEVYVMDWGLARVKNLADRHDVRVRTNRSDAEAPDVVPEVAGFSVETDRRDASGARADEALYTMDGDIIGTPSYMSPEQARGELAAIDERSDVYSVGAMLYRLLAGTAPFTVAGERAHGGVVWKRVVDGPPPAVESLAPKAPPELVAICEKAMARAPGARYQNMHAFATDVRAFLEGRVVGAFETGAIAEGRKWVRRNRGLAGALAAAMLALVAGLTGSLVFAGRARDNARIAEERRVEAAGNAALAEQRRQEAATNAAEAEQQARIAKEVNSFLNDDLLSAIAPEHEGKDVTVRHVLDQAATRLDLAGFVTDPEVEAALRTTIGTSYDRLGEHEIARRHLERSLELRRRDQGERSEPALRSMRNVAAAWAALGRSADAIGLYREALDLAQEVLGPEHKGTLATMGDLAGVLVKVGRVDEARELHEAALPVQVRVLGEDALDTLTTRNNLALLDQKQGRLAAAEAAMRDVFERRRAILGEGHPETILAMNNLAMALGELGRLGEGEELAADVLDAYREMHAADHPKVATATANLGTFAFRRGRLRDAEKLFREALRLHLLRNAPDSAVVLHAKHNLATAIDDPQRIEEVFALRREVLEGRRSALGPEHPETLESMHGLAATLREASRYDESEALYRETLELRREVLGPEHPHTLITLENLGGVLFAKGDHEGSEALTREVLASRRRVLGDRHPDVAKTMLNLAIVAKARGDTAGALQAVEESLVASRAAYGNVHQQVATCLRTLGDLRSDAKAHAEALAAYQEALGIHRRLGPDGAAAGYLLHQIGYQFLQLQDHANALQNAVDATKLRESLSGKDAMATRVSLRLQARALVASKRFAEAEPIALDLVERTSRIDGADSENTKRSRSLLVELYEGWGKPDEAAKWR